MFCPSCGLEEIQSNQFCRACGTDLRTVRRVVEKPDSITASAETAREEIGRAIAAKIQQTDSSSELSKFAERALPEIEKFLESPEEKSLRRIRAGSMVSFIGVGVSIGFMLAGIFSDPDLFVPAALGLVTFFIGLSLIANGVYFTRPKKLLEERSAEALSQRELDDPNTSELLMPPRARTEFPSVTEHTTRHLKEKP